MTFSALILQLLNGLAGASSLFMVAAGLSLIFGVTRIVNFAHGSLTMLGMYVAVSASEWLGTNTAAGFWGAVLLGALATAALGALIEMVLLRRIYHAPELFQLLATFALVLVIKDAALVLWGAEEILGPRAPGLTGAVDLLGQLFPLYNLALIAGIAVAVARVDAYPLGHAGTRCHARPRDAGRTRCQSGVAVYECVCARRVSRRIGRGGTDAQ